MPATSEKQANLFRAALGNPVKGSKAYDIKHHLDRETIKHFAHLDESRKKQTDSVEFKNWFGNSVVINPDGSPREVYHGTTKDFKEFDIEKSDPNNTMGAYFSTCAVYASNFGAGENGNIGKYYLSIQNPADDDLEFDIKSEVREKLGHHDGKLVRDKLIQLGYDGVERRVHDRYIYIAFYKHQIKSAITNTGKFDKNNPDVTSETLLNELEIVDEARLNYDQFAKTTQVNWPSRGVNAMAVTPSQPEIMMTNLGDTSVTFTAKSSPSTEGKSHKCSLTFFSNREKRAELKNWWKQMRGRFSKLQLRQVPKSILTAEDLRKMTCKANCDCNDFKYSFEVANARKGMSDIKSSNGQTPDIKNPTNKVGMCKHLLSLIKYLVADGRAQAKLREASRYNIKRSVDLPIDKSYTNSYSEYQARRKSGDDDEVTASRLEMMPVRGKKLPSGDFKTDVLSSLESYTKRISYARSNIVRIDSGSSRVVYKLGDAIAIKIAKSHRGVPQNKAEVELFDKLIKDGSEISQFFTNVIDYDVNYYWVSYEYAAPLNKQSFKSTFGVDFSEFARDTEELGVSNDYNTFAEKYKDSKLKLLVDLLGGKHAKDKGYIADIGYTTQWGTVIRNNTLIPVLVDYGMTEEIWTNLYEALMPEKKRMFPLTSDEIRDVDGDLYDRSDESYGTQPTKEKLESFKTQALDDLHDYVSRMRHIAGHTEKINSGSSRAVYKLNDVVVKIAKNRVGVIQNKNEINFFNRHANDEFQFLAKITKTSKHGYWVEMELATEFNPDSQLFKDSYGVSFAEYETFVMALRSKNFDLSIKMANENKFFKYLLTLFKELMIEEGNAKFLIDYINLRNFGVVNRSGKQVPVIIDYGMDDQTFTTNYLK